MRLPKLAKARHGAQRSALLSMFLLFSVAISGKASEQQQCTPLTISVTQTDPMRATLRWTPRAGAVAFFIQYSTGKFPTQELGVHDGSGTAEAGLYNLTPGQSYTIELCEALVAGACPGLPGPNSCLDLVTFTAASAWPDTVQPDPAHAVCAMTPDVAIAGEWPGDPDEAVLPAATADDCCMACATAYSWLPYTAQCTHFVFDPTAQQCFLKRERLGDIPVPGAISGEVRAWPVRQ